MLFIIIVLLVFITQSVFTFWWLAMLDAFVVSLFMGKSAWIAFLSGFAGVGLVWFGQIYYINHQNEGLLLRKIAEFFPFSPTMLFTVTVLIGAFSGGLGAWAGYSIRALWKKEEI